MKMEHDSERFSYEQSKKLELAMRAIRYELPGENNLILDVSIGEILKADGTPFNLKLWAAYTGQSYAKQTAIFKAKKKLILQKLHRKNYMEIISDTDKKSEDFYQKTSIEKQLKQKEEDEAIIEYTDVKSFA